MNDPIFFNYFSNQPETLGIILEHFSLFESEEEEEESEQIECIGPQLQINTALDPLPLGMVLVDTYILKEEEFQ